MIYYILTNQECIVTDHFIKYPAPGIPVLFNNNGIFEVPSKWLMSVALNEKDVLSSVSTYADHLVAFFKYIEDLKVPKELGRKKYSWKDITDKHFHSFIKYKRDQGSGDTYIGNIITTTFRFYRWAEQNNFLRKHVAIYDDDLPYAISATKNPRKGTWTWPYIPSTESRFLDVPTNEDLEKAHVKAFEMSENVGRRDSLLMSIYERTARRSDALQLTIDQVPSEEEIEDAIIADEDKPFEFKVTGKRKVTRTLKLLPETTLELREYIDTERAEIVAKVKRRDKTYKDPGLIFISFNDGKPLSPNYVSARISDILGDAGSGHRVRAKGLTDIVIAFDGVDKDGKPLAAKDVLLRAAEEAGHNSTHSLRTYLANARSSSLASKIFVQERQRTLENKIEQHKRMLAKLDILKPLVDAVVEGRDISEEILKKILEETSNEEI